MQSQPCEPWAEFLPERVHFADRPLDQFLLFHGTEPLDSVLGWSCHFDSADAFLRKLLPDDYSEFCLDAVLVVLEGRLDLLVALLVPGIDVELGR